MHVLAIDTASRTCSVAVCRNDDILAEITDGSGETHSRHLMAMVDRALSMSVGKLEAIDGLAVNRGPGSFTGVRIGISTAKGLAAAAGRPLVGVSGLAVLAWQALPTPHVICPMLDARRQEVYCARYRFQDGRLVALTPETVCPPEAALKDAGTPVVLIGDGARAYRDRLAALLGPHFDLAPAFQHPIRAGVLAIIARPRLEQSENDLETLVPQYIRPSYAREPVDNPGESR